MSHNSSAVVTSTKFHCDLVISSWLITSNIITLLCSSAPKSLITSSPWSLADVTQQIRARFLSLAQSKLRLCSANHRTGYFSNLACDWLSIVWAYSEQETENRKRALMWWLLQNFTVIQPSQPGLLQASLYFTTSQLRICPQWVLVLAKTACRGGVTKISLWSYHFGLTFALSILNVISQTNVTGFIWGLQWNFVDTISTWCCGMCRYSLWAPS